MKKITTKKADKGWGIKVFSSSPSFFAFAVTFLILFCGPGFISAQDFGFVLSQKGALTGGDEWSGEYLAALGPWFAAPLGERGDLYLSGNFSGGYNTGGGEWKFLPELYRTAIAYNPVPNLRLEIGRLPFDDCLSQTMAGLFDGLALRLNIGGGRLSAGVFYTGLLYKKAANIVMTLEDQADYLDEERYFASRRLAAGLNWEHTGIFDSRNNLSLSGLCQFDLNGAGGSIHSQYLEAKLDLPLSGRVNSEFGLIAELAEQTGKEPAAAFAALAEITWLLPTAIPDRLSLGGRFSSGAWNDTVNVFIPLSSQAQGKVLRPMLSGIALAGAAYTARFHHTVSADFSAAYFFRTDTVSWHDGGTDPDSVSPLIGGELYGALNWLPLSDLLIQAGAGVFLPGTGRVYTDAAPLKYRIDLSANISF